MTARLHDFKTFLLGREACPPNSPTDEGAGAACLIPHTANNKLIIIEFYLTRVNIFYNLHYDLIFFDNQNVVS